MTIRTHSQPASLHSRLRIRRGRDRGLGCLVSLLLACSCPAQVELEWPAELAPARKELLTKGLAFLKEHPAIPYLNGRADAAGMDCSGAIVWLLAYAKIEPPRTAHGQYEWLQKSGRFTVVPATVRRVDDPIFEALQPGDLIFWAHDGKDAPEELHVSHVHMFLGKEKDGHAVMIGSSDGRGYRGIRMSGFGIVDFHVPKEGSPTRIVGFGSPFPAPAEKRPNLRP